MGFASYYYENDLERAQNNWIACAAFEDKFRHEPVFVAASPPLQPVISTVAAPSVRPEPETVAKRAQSLREEHTLALLELMPGHRWRH
jgi:hypothetical protein